MNAIPAIFEDLTTLSDATRGRMLLVLEKHELTVSELCAVLQLPQSTVSRHLKTLSDSSWVASRRDGTSRYYSLAPARAGHANGAASGSPRGSVQGSPRGEAPMNGERAQRASHRSGARRRSAERATVSGSLRGEAPRMTEDAHTRRLWSLLRGQIAATPGADQDARRLKGVLGQRQTKSEEFFASSAGQWDRLRRDLFGGASALHALPALIDPSWTVGDLGCGTGETSAALAPFVKRTIAVDRSGEMLQAARARAEAGRPPDRVRHAAARPRRVQAADGPRVARVRR
jgi:DNA-binding transcriptional ArsR family regulator